MNKKWIWLLLALVFYGALYFSFLYRPGFIRMDDFGYLQSVIETLAAGRLHLDAWLEPYSATLISICSLAYRVSGNFPARTWGVQAIFVLINFLLFHRLISKSVAGKSASLLTLWVATQPVYWHKCSEFAGNIFTLTFVLAALLAYRNKKWTWFFLAAFFAFANRQNSIALLTLPAFHFLHEGLWKHRRGAPILAGFAAFGVAALVLHGQMNHTIAQVYGIYAKMDAGKAVAIFHTLLTGIGAGLAFLSFFAFVMGSDVRANLRANFQKPLPPLLCTIVFLMLPVIWKLPIISFLTPLIGSLDRSYALQWMLILIIPSLFWILDWRVLRFDGPFCLFAAYTVLSSMKGFWYDFYLIDVALAALFLLLSRKTDSAPETVSVPATDIALSRGRILLVWTMIIGNIGWAYGYRILSDKQLLSIRVYENLERQGKIAVDDMTDATFGYLGWKLFDQYWRHERITDLANFLCYVRHDRVAVETDLPWRKSFRRGDLAGAEVIEEGRVSVGFFPLRYRVVNLHGTTDEPLCVAGPLTLDRTAYMKKIFPLNAGEWSDYIKTLQMQP